MEKDFLHLNSGESLRHRWMVRHHSHREGAELGPHAPLSQVVTPNRGNTQACRMNQRTRTPTGIKNSIVLLSRSGVLKSHDSLNRQAKVIRGSKYLSSFFRILS